MRLCISHVFSQLSALSIERIVRLQFIQLPRCYMLRKVAHLLPLHCCRVFTEFGAFSFERRASLLLLLVCQL